MSLYDNIGQQNPQQALQELRSNPAAVLKHRGLNIPDGMTDPQQIVNHLLTSGQIAPPRLQMAQRLMGMRR
jgi:hypothetical protein